jgi:hypothetical protein
MADAARVAAFWDALPFTERAAVADAGSELRAAALLRATVTEAARGGAAARRRGGGAAARARSARDRRARLGARASRRRVRQRFRSLCALLGRDTRPLPLSWQQNDMFAHTIYFPGEDWLEHFF